MPDLSVSIATANHRQMLRECLDSIYGNTARVSLEVFVIDSGSVDGTIEMVTTDFPAVRVIRNQRFRGYSAANNQALLECTGRYAMILNDDTLIERGAFDKMVAFMDAHPEVGAVGPYLQNRDGTHQRSSYVGFPSLRTECFTRAFPLSWLWNRRQRSLPPYSDYVDPYGTYNGDPLHVRRVKHLMGACILVRREVVEMVGVLDEGFFLTYEDQDWCKRIDEAGWQVVYYPEARIVHLGGETVRGLQGYGRIYRESRYYFQKKHFDRISAFLVKPLFVGIAVSNRSWSAAMSVRKRVMDLGTRTRTSAGAA